MKMIDAERIIAPHIKKSRFHITMTWPVGAWGTDAALLLGHMYLVLASLFPSIPVAPWIVDSLHVVLVAMSVALFGAMMSIAIGVRLTKSYSDEAVWLGETNKEPDLGEASYDLLKVRAIGLEQKFQNSGWMLSIIPSIRKKQIEAMMFGMAALFISQSLASISGFSHWWIAGVAIILRFFIGVQMTVIRDNSLDAWESLHTSGFWD